MTKDPKLTRADIYRFVRSEPFRSKDPSLESGHSLIGFILSEINKKALLGFDEKEIESIKLRSWTSPETLSQNDLLKLEEYYKAFWAEFQTRIDAEVQKISSKK